MRLEPLNYKDDPWMQTPTFLTTCPFFFCLKTGKALGLIVFSICGEDGEEKSSNARKPMESLEIKPLTWRDWQVKSPLPDSGGHQRRARAPPSGRREVRPMEKA